MRNRIEAMIDQNMDYSSINIIYIANRFRTRGKTFENIDSYLCYTGNSFLLFVTSYLETLSGEL